MCKKTPWYQPACWIFFRPSLIFSARCARGGTPYIFFARFARGQTIDTPRFPKNLKVSVRPARKIFKNGREKKRKKTKINLGFLAFLAKIRIYPDNNLHATPSIQANLSSLPQGEWPPLPPYPRPTNCHCFENLFSQAHPLTTYVVFSVLFMILMKCSLRVRQPCGGAMPCVRWCLLSRLLFKKKKKLFKGD